MSKTKPSPAQGDLITAPVEGPAAPAVASRATDAAEPTAEASPVLHEGEIKTTESLTLAPVQAPAPVVLANRNGKVSMKELLLVAIERGTPVEQLTVLADLHDRAEAREASLEFNRALAAFKAECPPIVHSKTANFKTRSGSAVNYSYTELDELARTIDPVLARHGFSYSWDERLAQGLVTTTCTLFHSSGHSRQSSFTLPAENDSAASPQQKIGMADTYAARRSLIAVLGLTTADKDPRPAEIDPTPISDDQLAHLEDLTKEARINMEKFLSYLQVGSLKQLPAVRYRDAESALQQKIEKARRSK